MATASSFLLREGEMTQNSFTLAVNVSIGLAQDTRAIALGFYTQALWVWPVINTVFAYVLFVSKNSFT